ncbi:MAG: hypothetical protein EP330_19400 [Deltaproteobacteria bacterium]|nr:MAG: hypothetical protein EP330_19400 [Deltaproteobacteria bacterium]
MAMHRTRRAERHQQREAEQAEQQGPGFDQERGNAAAQEALRRSDLVVRPVGPVFDGHATARQGPEDTTHVTAPRVHFDARADLAPGVTTDGIIEFGLAQTLESTERHLIYEDDRGREVFRTAITVPRSRDAQYVDDSHLDEAVYRAPFYSQPECIMESGVDFHTADQPSFDAQNGDPVGAGRLARIEGHDHLRSAFVAEHDDTQVFFQRYDWSIPWDMEISESHRGESDRDVDMHDTRAMPSLLEGDIATGRARDRYGLPSMDAAMNAPIESLFYVLKYPERGDGQSRRWAIEALRRRNPHLRVQLGVVETNESFGDDEIVLTARGDQTANTEAVSIGTAETGEFSSIRFLDVFDPEHLSARSALHLSAADTGLISGAAHTIRWAMPFPTVNRATPMRGPAADGRYTVLSARWE